MPLQQKVRKMNTIEIKEYVDRLFRSSHKANRKRGWAEIPIVGGHYAPGEDNVRPLKKLACAALAAREWFYENGPADLQPLPLSYDEREDVKREGGLSGLSTILGLYARSLACRDYDVDEHPSFFEYACGLMASDFIGGYAGMQENQQLRRRFPPRVLPGLGPGLCWRPPKEHARMMESWRRSRERQDSVRAISAARDAGGNRVVVR
jgi:hypothetical protein